MNGAILIYVGGFFLLSWGTAHLLATRNVIRGFGEISPDNQRIIAMEWITEGVALIFIGLLVSAVTYLDRTCLALKVVYWSSFAVLNAMSIVSLFTGFKNAFVAFKLCPLIFTSASTLIVLGAYLD